MHEVLQLMATVVPLVAAIWHVAEVKHEIEKEMDIIVCQADERRNFVDYKLNNLEEKINHQLERLIDEIESLKLEIRELRK